MDTPHTPKIILGVAAHPDDLDFGAAGSIAVWAEADATIYYLILTNGNKGSEDSDLTSEQLIEIRREEQRKAAALLGVKEVFFLDYEDGTLEVTQSLKKDIVRLIRKLKPDTVITFDPSMLYVPEAHFINHPDHRAAGQATLDAVFPLARDHLTFPDLLTNEGLEPHKVQTMLLKNFEKQNYFVDITDVFEQKLKAVAAHTSQIADIKHTTHMIENMARKNGEMIGAEFAEGFVRIDLE